MMAGVAGLRWLGKMTAPAFAQPVQHLKVGIRKDDRESVVRSTALQIPSDIDATLAVEEPRHIGHFVAGYPRCTVIGSEEE
jgi:hypothetical protein